jgi:hypothetical protein
MAADYERQRLGQAVHVLAVSAAPIQKRLEYAFDGFHTLINHGLHKPERQAQFESIVERMTAREAVGREGSVAATVSRFSDDEASAIAREIADLYPGICHDAIYELEDKLKGR